MDDVEGRQDMAEDKRLLYVALTRAQRRLVMSGACDPENIPRGSWLALFHELHPFHLEMPRPLRPDSVTILFDDQLKNVSPLPERVQKPPLLRTDHYENMTAAISEPALKSWSVTRLATMLKCPRRLFLEERRAAAPVIHARRHEPGPNPSLYGTMVHELYQHAASDSAMDTLLVEKIMTAHEHESLGDLPRLKQRLTQALSVWRDSMPPEAMDETQSHREWTFEMALGDYRMQGVMDLVVVSDAGAWIVDYKTSSQQVAARGGGASDGQSLRMEYHFQLQLYQAAYEFLSGPVRQLSIFSPGTATLTEIDRVADTSELLLQCQRGIGQWQRNEIGVDESHCPHCPFYRTCHHGQRLRSQEEILASMEPAS